MFEDTGRSSNSVAAIVSGRDVFMRKRIGIAHSSFWNSDPLSRARVTAGGPVHSQRGVMPTILYPLVFRVSHVLAGNVTQKKLELFYLLCH